MNNSYLEFKGNENVDVNEGKKFSKRQGIHVQKNLVTETPHLVFHKLIKPEENPDKKKKESNFF